MASNCELRVITEDGILVFEEYVGDELSGYVAFDRHVAQREPGNIVQLIDLDTDRVLAEQ